MESEVPISNLLPPQPSGAVVRVHAAEADRLVLDVPPGGRTSGLGCFVVIWNGFMIIFTTVMCFSFFQNKGPESILYPALFISVFWLVGFGLIYGWIKLKFEHSFLLVDRERAVLRKMLFGRQRQTEIALDEFSRASLTESYQENDNPIYRVTISGVAGQSLHFGTSLEPAEQDWCVDAIHVILRPAELAVPAADVGTPTLCDACGADLPADAFRNDEGAIICPACSHEQTVPMAVDLLAILEQEPIPEELPGVVTILEDSPERMGLRLGLSEFAAVRWIVAGITGLFAGIWWFVTLKEFGDTLLMGRVELPNDVFDGVRLVMTILFSLAGLMPATVALLALFGRITTWIDRDWLTVRVHVGPLGKKWKMAVADITAIRLSDPNDMPSGGRNPRITGPHGRPLASDGLSRAAAVFAGRRILVMTVLHRLRTARFVVHKVRTWLATALPGKVV